MHSCCAVDASGGEGAIAGFSLLLRLKLAKSSGSLSLAAGCHESAAAAG